MLDELRAEITGCMLVDQPALRRRLGRLARAGGGGGGAADLDRLAADVARSRGRRAGRSARLPRPTFPEELPVSARRAEIMAALAGHQVVVVCGETGSGKTTQLPKICLAMGRGAAGLIGHTQPRRIAARSVARRIAREMGGVVGGAVGFKVRFTEEVGEETYVKVMTDGILLNEIRRDRHLHRYDTIIIDEAHERSLNIDFLLGYLQRLLPRRPDLKVIVTSATIDTGRISAHFGGAPILEISGRTYPVEAVYRPPAPPDDGAGEGDPQAGLVDGVREALGATGGDVLVFLPGEREIREAAAALRRGRLAADEILPLYARLNAAQQDRVFAPHAGRRIVLATNVAETSLTVPGVRAVVDTGLARISRYSHRTKVQRLPVERVSRASAHQRMGRSGRVGPGLCVRLYSADDLGRRAEFTEPEVRRTSLAAVILQMVSLGLGRIEEFPFLDPPDRRYITDGYRLLRELGALDGEDRLTPVGRRLARLPVDPRVGRMLLAAGEHGCVTEVLAIASGLSAGDPRDRPFEKRAAADEAHAAFRDRQSDFMTQLRIWEFFQENSRRLTAGQMRRLSRERYLSYGRLREWREVHRQLTLLAREIGLRRQREPAGYAQIHRALLTGLLSHVGVRRERREYQGVRNLRFVIGPGSVARGGRLRWVVAAELVETNQLYAHTVARIRPEWIEAAASSQVTRSYFEAYWEPRRAEVMAFERVEFLGLTIAAKRRVRFGLLMPGEARRIFIQEGLVEGRFRTDAPFVRHNHALSAAIEAVEHKIRRPGLLVDDGVVYAFFDERIPAGVNRGVAFDKWYREARPSDPRLLFLSRERLLRPGGELPREAEYPDHLEVAGARLRLRYRFEPGDPEDGLTVLVPLPLLPQLRPERFEWLVPGYRREKVVELLRSLPKSIRRHLVPIPARADACLEAPPALDEPICAVLARRLRATSGVTVPPEAWRPEALPDHLRMNFALLDEADEVVASGRSLERLAARFGPRAARRFTALAAARHARSGLTDWSFGEVPPRLAIEAGGGTIWGYPGLEDRGSSVTLRVWESAAKAEAAHPAGIRRLFLLQLGRALKGLTRDLPDIQELSLLYVMVPEVPDRPSRREGGAPGGRGGAGSLERELVLKAVDRCFLTEPPVRWTEPEFRRRLARGQGELPAAAREVCGVVRRILRKYRDTLGEREGLRSPPRRAVMADIDAQLDGLVYRGFVADTPWRHLQQLPRYLDAVTLRLAKLKFGLTADRRKLLELDPLLDRYRSRREAAAAGGVPDAGLDDLRWMLEELRISLFAQEIGTLYPVSVKRLEATLEPRFGS